MARQRQRRGAWVSRTHATEGESNGIQNGLTINGDTNETSPANVTANMTDNLHNPSLPEGRKPVRVSKGLFHNSSMCSRQITRIFKERIDEAGYTWTKMSQSTKNFYFGEFKESIYKRPPMGFELFLHTHTSGHDKKHLLVRSQKQLMEENPASTESQVDETTLYIATASGAKKRNLYGAGSKRVDYLKDSGNETAEISKADDGWEKKSMKMERKINKLNKTLEIVCSRFNITLSNCDSDGENGDGGDAHQDPKY